MIFSNETQNSFFTKNGYLVVDFYSSEKVDELKNEFNRLNLTISSDYAATIDSDTKSKIEINGLLERFFEPLINQVLFNYTFLFGAFTIKQVGDKSVKPSHQDWSFVDEDQFSGIGVWCPLNNVNELNGCLGVIPGSHRYIKNYRGTQTRTEFEPVASYAEKNLFKFLEMKKGQVLFFDNRILHYSKANHSSEVRLVAGCATAPKQAKIYHFIGSENSDKIEKREVSKNFFFETDFSEIEYDDTNRCYIRNSYSPMSLKTLRKLVYTYDTRPFVRLKSLFLNKFNL